jgi:hypothetical protein
MLLLRPVRALLRVLCANRTFFYAQELNRLSHFVQAVSAYAPANAEVAEALQHLDRSVVKQPQTSH